MLNEVDNLEQSTDTFCSAPEISNSSMFGIECIRTCGPKSVP